MTLPVAVFESFEALPPHFAASFERANANFDCTPAWMAALAKHTLDPADGLRLYVCTQSDGQALALLPMRSTRSRFGGRHVAALSSYYTAAFEPLLLCPAVDARPVLCALLEFITRERPSWDTIRLSSLARPSPVFEMMQSELQACGLPTQTYFRFANWYLDVAGRSYEQYHASLPSQLRSTLARRMKALARQERPQFAILAGPAGVDAALNSYTELYQRRWGGGEPHEQFIPAVVERYARDGILRLGTLSLGPRIAAAQIWFVKNRTASMFKIAHDPRLSQFSVGSLLTAHVLRYVIDADRVHTVDFLSGDEEYKRMWMSQRRERWGLLAFSARTPRGLSLAAFHKGARGLKRLLTGRRSDT